MFVDEAGFHLLNSAVATYAPTGQTPVLRAPLKWGHWSVISAITSDGKLYTHMQDKAFKARHIVPFLKHLLRHIDGKLLIVWDGLPAHRGKEIKAFLQAGATERIYFAQLPPYAPDLNPAEGVWGYLKYVEMKNLCCHTLDELRYELCKAIARLRHKTHIIQACIQQVHLGQNL